MQSLKNIRCSNPNCREILGQTDGKKIVPANEQVFSKLLSHRKNKSNPLYCIRCHRITRFYRGKLKSKSKFRKRDKVSLN